MHRTQNLIAPAADTDDSTVVVTSADILRGAARYLENRGWTQKSYYAADPGSVSGRPTAPFPAACVLGAIGMAAHGHVTTMPTDHGPGVRDCRSAVTFLQSYLDDLGITVETFDDWATEPANLVDWNDRDDQTAEYVIAKLRAAADEWVWTHATDDQVETFAEACYATEKLPTREGFIAWLGAR